MKKLNLILALFLALIARSSAQLGNGIYATFDTSLGIITSKLHYAEAPMTIANFIGLAEGSRPWVDEDTGVIRNAPYFDDTIVVRIADIPSTIVQAGTRTGTNSGGPGYGFPDEFDPSLRHLGFGILSMANSGKNTNGSQFFFTTDTLTGLDDKHTVFGQVISGSNVLQNISDVVLDAGGVKPATDIVFNAVSILRVGTDAEAFDINAQGLPDLEPVDFSFQMPIGDNLEVIVPWSSNGTYRTVITTNLESWFITSTDEVYSAVPTNTIIVPNASELPDTGYVTVYKVAYDAIVPSDLADADILLTDLFGGTLLRLNADGEFGVVEFNNGDLVATITQSLYTPGHHHGLFRVIYDTVDPFRLDLNLTFTNAVSGFCEGTAYFENGNQPSFTSPFTFGRSP